MVFKNICIKSMKNKKQNNKIQQQYYIFKAIQEKEFKEYRDCNKIIKFLHEYK